MEVTERTPDSVILGWDGVLPTTPTMTTVFELQRHDLVHHLPPSVESTLASLPYDDLDFPPCIDGAFYDDSPTDASLQL